VIELSRRGFFSGLAATIAAPAVIRTPGLLMQVKAVQGLPPVPKIVKLDDERYRYLEVLVEIEQRFVHTILFGNPEFAPTQFSFLRSGAVDNLVTEQRNSIDWRSL
jgi:hypothetical protein